MALIGLNVVEVDGKGAPAIQGAATSVTAFLVQTQRGLPHTPTRISSFQQFTERFGGFFPGGLGAYLVKGFFDNGGRAAYVSRVAPGDAAQAALVLSDSGDTTLRLEGGHRGKDDPGSWANDLYASVKLSSSATSRLRETAPAAVVGSVALAATTNMAAAPVISVRVDGEVNPTVISWVPADWPDGAATATREQIRDAINRKTTKLKASINGGNNLVLTSTGEVARVKKDWTSLQVGVANATLGFAVQNSATTGTPAAFTGTKTTLASASDFAVGDLVRVTDGVDTAVVKVVRVDAVTGEVEWGTTIATPGNFDPLATTVSNLEFDLTLAKGDPANVVETWKGLTMEKDAANYAPQVLNDELRGSRFVVATDEASSTVGNRNPVASDFTRFSPGNEGTATVADFIGSEAGRTGLYALDAYDVQLVVSERTDPAFVANALGYCAGRGDCMLVGSVPAGSVGGGTAVAYGQAFQGKKVYGALYGPWIKIFDPAGAGPNPVRFVPPAGHVAGVYARIEATRGIHKAPAGDEANVVGALDVEHRLSDADHDDLVRNGSVNGIRVVPRAGVVVDASRTLSTDTRWLYVNVRLLFNYVKSSLKQGLTWVRQEPNRDRLWSTIKFSSVTPFLMRLWRQGAFGTGDPDDVFTVVVDASNNPPDEVEQGNLKVEVYFYPSRPAETIVVVVGQQPSGGIAAEA